MPQQTKRIRIAVSVNEFGQWAAWGRWDMRDESNMQEANGNVVQDGLHACYFVEVDIPVPDYITLQDGKVLEYKEPLKTDD